MTAYQFIVPEDENEIQTYVAEVDEEELYEFASWVNIRFIAYVSKQYTFVAYVS
jgi:hypothetical protein